jgi:hypothetical protein
VERPTPLYDATRVKGALLVALALTNADRTRECSFDRCGLENSATSRFGRRSHGRPVFQAVRDVEIEHDS